MNFIKLSKRDKILVSVIATIIIFVGYYLAIYKSFSYQSKKFMIGNVMMLISLSLFPMLWLNIAEYSKKKIYVYIVAPLVFIGFISVFVTIAKKIEYLEEELNKHGINVVGKVIGFEVERHRRTKTEHATFKYEFENKQFIQRIENYDDEYKLNQNLNLKISKRNPEMFKIIEAEK